MGNVKYVDVTLSDGAKIPDRHYTGDAGFDLYISEDVDIPAGKTVDVHTGVRFRMPYGIFARITGRSSTMRKHGLLVNEGIIDNGYTGEMFVSVHNLNPKGTFKAKKGMRLAQVIFQRIEDIRLVAVESIEDGDRGCNGFGSTGE